MPLWSGPVRPDSWCAFEELVQRHQRAVRRITVGYVRDPEEARDIAQETFLRVYQTLGRLGAPD